jgi:hypothetical protein
MRFFPLLLVSGCASAIMPKAPDTGEVMGGSGVIVVDRETVLVIDWPAADRKALASAMDGGVVAVKMDGSVPKPVAGCSVGDKYEYHSVSRQEETKKLSSSDDIKASMPTNGTSFLSKLNLDKSSSSSLDMAIVVVGIRSAKKPPYAKKDLTGSCEGATHYIRRAHMGAFAYSSGEKSQNRSTAELFKIVPVNIDPQKDKNESFQARDGDISACQNATEGDTPVPNCDALVRVEIAKIRD